ncbi:hypothetical protein JCGZ_01519 [Jatropha curcas]|uniref:Myb-like domain-containing protein n=1 Tax=Jatropha curcas TaxID=180498 RepID=A0A067LKZ2_JATCU|nr:trihelix transcription factor PTL [Jatropha curcas]XP_020539710.1 trihelix transcription factor PTL [Jatropha curcas]KDP45019.1 hypothetical protein JCGZ_01519 [Jatropha curcas]
MGDHQYGLPDLRQLLATGRTHFSGLPQVTEPFFVQTSRNLAPQQTHNHHHFHDSIMAAEVMVSANSGLVKLGQDHYFNNATTTSSNSTFFGVEMENGWINNGNDVGNNSRWPRQETLTLLEIRSRLDSRFKEANQKGPLWDEVSRIMAEEHGYQRSGKKCREKFENLYKYYKKTKEGKAGRQDGKHYRFFRQLEALYGETSNQLASSSETHLVNDTNRTSFLYPTPINPENKERSLSFQENKNSESLSLSNTSEFETSSSDNNDDDLSAIAYDMMNRKIGKPKGRLKKGWKGKVKDFVDLQMGKLLEKQEAWMERMLKTIEDREKERICREEEWAKQEMARLDQIHEYWAKERARIEARDVALMEELKKYADNCERLGLSSSVEQIVRVTQTHYKNKDQRNAKKIDIDEINFGRWSDPEICSLIQIRTAMEARFQESSSGYSEEFLWEEIASKMGSLGYDRDVEEIKEKWENMNIYFNMTTAECNKKRKEDLRPNNYFQQLDPYNNNGQEIDKLESLNLPSSSSYVVNSQMHGSISCFQESTCGARRISNFNNYSD